MDKIPLEYYEILKMLIADKRYGSFTLIIQAGKIIGCDVTIKERNMAPQNG